MKIQCSKVRQTDLVWFEEVAWYFWAEILFVCKFCSLTFYTMRKIQKFSKWRIFSYSWLFLGKLTFLQILADFVIGFEKLLFQLKALQKLIPKDVNIFFVAQTLPEIYRNNVKLKTGGMCFFVADCIYGLACNFKQPEFHSFSISLVFQC